MTRNFIGLSWVALSGAHLLACGGSNPTGTLGASGDTASSGGAMSTGNGASGSANSGATSGSSATTGTLSGSGSSAGNLAVSGSAATGSAASGAGSSGAGTAGSTGGGSATGTAGPSGSVSSSTGGSTGNSSSVGPTADEVRARAEAYKTANSGNGGKDWDIISCCGGASRTPASLAADAEAQRLRSLCGKDQLPVIPILAWEYGGMDHQWISPQSSALVYCVFIPVNPDSSHWQFDMANMRVTADVYVKFPDQNPCKNEQGANQVMACLGNPTNIEILVDTASYHDGADVGYTLANAKTNLNLILPDGSRIPMYMGL